MKLLIALTGSLFISCFIFISAYLGCSSSGKSEQIDTTINIPPKLDSIGDKYTYANQPLSFIVTATDPNADDLLTLSLSSLPTGASFVPGTGAFSWTPTYEQSGTYQITFTVTDNGTPKLSDNEKITIIINVAIVDPVIIRKLPHDTFAFTQGFLIHDRKLYESTGHYGSSSLRRINIDNGEIEKKIPVSDEFFAEGLALMDDKMVQLTWTNGKALIYSYPSLSFVSFFSYNRQGWGLTTCDSFYIMSDGSDTLLWRDKNFSVKNKLAVTCNSKRLSNLNELEFVNGKIYANVWYSDYIYEINPTDGKVRRIIDCTTLTDEATGHLTSSNVLNGIAYYPEKNTFFLTGKNWPLIFEVTFPD